MEAQFCHLGSKGRLDLVTHEGLDEWGCEKINRRHILQWCSCCKSTSRAPDAETWEGWGKRGDLNREVEWWDVEEEERRGKVELSLKRLFVSSSVYSSPQFFTMKPLRHSTVAVPLRVWRRVLFQGFPFGILCIVEVWNTSVRQWTSASGRGTLKISYLAWVQVILSTTEKRD